MTGLPAERFGLEGRGRVAVGSYADLAVFDPETVACESTYVEPNRYSSGMPYVIVNGELVVEGGALTDARPGRPLLGPGYARPAAD